MFPHFIENANIQIIKVSLFIKIIRIYDKIIKSIESQNNYRLRVWILHEKILQKNWTVIVDFIFIEHDFFEVVGDRF